MSGSRRVSITVGSATAYAAAYQVLIVAGADLRLILGLFALSPFVLCHMAYVILKYGKPSTSTFDEKFYEDVDEIRNSAGRKPRSRVLLPPR
jgi:hypothetical protein